MYGLRTPTIKVTALERDWLYNERRKALSECPTASMCIAHVPDGRPPVPAAYLLIYERDRDGCLLAEIKIVVRGVKRRYVRKLRVPACLGSTSGRDIRLRRAGRSA